MLAAASVNSEGYPALFQLALQILSHDRQLPGNLHDYLHRVFNQAAGLASDSSQLNAETLPDAIQLAVAIRQSTELRGAIETGRATPISAELARNLLALGG